MWWTVFLLGLLILVGFGVAIYMAIYHHGTHPVRKKEVPRKNKATQVTIVRQEANGIDIEELVARVATAVASKVSEDMIEKIKELGQYVPVGQRAAFNQQLANAIEIDESIIPMAIETEAVATNLENMVTEEETKDEGLSKSKSKLAELLKKKNG